MVTTKKERKRQKEKGRDKTVVHSFFSQVMSLGFSFG
jgi:hypothetical protein